ncbi:hypothetical protein BDQ17DRAFT_1370023 [Cyathus striatus]|nr:hypothetical protein BDQ17DRAFT_1370023 [Cyathus striatus]
MGNATSHQHLHYHIQKLPLELIEQILSEACEDYRISVRGTMHEENISRWDSRSIPITHERSQTSLVTPGTLSRVCRTWKDIVYHTPMLWDTVQVSVTSKMKRWLSRAGIRPLTVKIEEHYQCSGHAEDLLIKELLAYSNRWENVDIFCPGRTAEVFSELQSIMAHNLPLLKSFTCRPSYHCRRASAHDSQHLPLRILAAPHLMQVSKYDRFPLVVSGSVIKTCTWNVMAVIPFINDLEHMENIKNCSINSPAPLRMMLQQSEETPPLLQLNYLTNLSLHNLDTSAIQYILPALELPALRRAQAQLRDASSIIWYILSLLQRSNSPDVEYLDLDISMQAFNEDELLDIFRIIPNLKHFKFKLKLWPESPEPYVDRPESIDFIYLRCLTTFYIDLDSLRFAGDIALLHYLTLPALEEFQVILPKSRSSRHLLTDLEDLVERSDCSLKTLKINTSVNISKTSLVNLLQALPTLECLHIIGEINYGGYKLTDTIFELLLPECHEVYLPNLSELSLEGILAPKIKWDDIIDAFEYRWEGDEDNGVKKLSRMDVKLEDPIRTTGDWYQRRITIRY